MVLEVVLQLLLLQLLLLQLRVLLKLPPPGGTGALKGHEAVVEAAVVEEAVVEEAVEPPPGPPEPQTGLPGPPYGWF